MPQQSPRNSQDHSNTVSLSNWSCPLPTQSAMLSNIPNVVDPIVCQEDEGGVTGTMRKRIPNFTHEDVYKDASGDSLDQDYGKLHHYTPGMQPVMGNMERSPVAMGGATPSKPSPPRSLPLVNNSSGQYDVIDTPTNSGAAKGRVPRSGVTPMSRPARVSTPGYEQVDSVRRQQHEDLMVGSPRVPLPRESTGSPVVNKQVSYPPKTAKPVPAERLYKRLEHSLATNKSVDSSGVDLETYSVLDHGQNDQNSASALKGYGELNHMERKVPPESSSKHPYVYCSHSSAARVVKGYAILHGDSNPRPSAPENKNQMEENDGYGRLSHARGTTVRVGNSNELSDRNLDQPKSRPVQQEGDAQSKFNPYDTMPRSNRVSVASVTSADSIVSDFGDLIEEEASTPIYHLTHTALSKNSNRANRDSRSTLEGTPPPGYETLSSYSRVERPSSNLSIPESSLAPFPEASSKPLVPPKRTSSKKRYENIGPNGEVLAEKGPPAPEDSPYENIVPSEQANLATAENPGSNVITSMAAETSNGDNGTEPVATVPSNLPATPSDPPPPDSKPQPAPKPKIKPKPRHI